MVMVMTAAAEDILQSLRAGHGPEGLMVSPFYQEEVTGWDGGVDRWALTAAKSETGWSRPTGISEEGTSEPRSKGHVVGVHVASQVGEQEPRQGRTS